MMFFSASFFPTLSISLSLSFSLFISLFIYIYIYIYIYSHINKIVPIQKYCWTNITLKTTNRIKLPYSLLKASFRLATSP